MTRVEFAAGVAYLEDGSGKKLSPAALEVYFDCLNDLDFEAFKLGAKRVLMEHKFATFPTIAELREASTLASRGAVVDIDPGEAWRMAEYLAAETDPEVSGSFANACKKLARQLGRDVPPAVIQAVKNFGLEAICNGVEPVGVIRGHFLRIYEGVAVREKRRALLPPKLTQAIESRAKPIENPANKMLAGIGKAVDE